ncbi:amidohydrolase [Mesorhizobium sp. J428]|uniref:amidohydrolase family protein n=1 Tax=Mesorhizobium sp. J428 TaxID=2898440 RepID=UPI002150EFF6|nr:amidohydrolase family protein [Mesorhizobium sp. J428]MCR5858606.1 amidohydrolase family protein [Mesorhizobium sp. J428]
MTRRIDAHQHFWRLSRGDYAWLTPDLHTIHRDFLPEDIKPLLRSNGISGTVLVQAAPTEAETEFMLSLARDHAFIEAVVGWVDFEAADAPARIAKLAADPKLKGLRPMIQDLPDDDWMLRPSLAPAFRALIGQGLVFDALVLPRHLTNLSVLLARHPGMRTIIDHCAKPAIAAGDIAGWAHDMRRLASETEAFCKLSGLVTEADAGWSVETLRPCVDFVLEHFGPDRLIWGSDWPVCLLASDYASWLEATDVLLGGCTDGERDAILGGNAIRAYGLAK